MARHLQVHNDLGGGNGDRFFEGLPLFGCGEGVENQRVPHEKFLLELLNDQLAGSSRTAPMDMAWRIAGYGRSTPDCNTQDAKRVRARSAELAWMVDKVPE